MNTNSVWKPDHDVIQKSQIVRWLRELGHNVDLDQPASAVNDLIRWSQEESADFWHELMEDLGIVWSTPYENVLDTSRGPEWADWFQGGKTNIALNCVDLLQRRPLIESLS